MSIFTRKKNTLFEIAMEGVSNLHKRIADGIQTLEKNKWRKIIESDPNSPLIMGMGTNKHMIYYPCNSTPYAHSYSDRFKYIEVLSGQITDQKTNKVYQTGSRIKLSPGQEVVPFTTNREAYIKVYVTTLDLPWSKISE